MKWFKQKLIAKPVQKNVIYYDRSVGVDHGRILNHECQNQILNSIRSWMSDNQIEGELVLFSGTKSDGSRVSIEDQFDTFRGAHTIIGPHGTGLVNVMWSDLYGDATHKIDRIHSRQYRLFKSSADSFSRLPQCLVLFAY